MFVDVVQYMLYVHMYVTLPVYCIHVCTVCALCCVCIHTYICICSTTCLVSTPVSTVHTPG